MERVGFGIHLGVFILYSIIYGIASWIVIFVGGLCIGISAMTQPAVNPVTGQPVLTPGMWRTIA